MGTQPPVQPSSPGGCRSNNRAWPPIEGTSGHPARSFLPRRVKNARSLTGVWAGHTIEHASRAGTGSGCSHPIRIKPRQTVPLPPSAPRGCHQRRSARLRSFPLLKALDTPYTGATLEESTNCCTSLRFSAPSSTSIAHQSPTRSIALGVRSPTRREKEEGPWSLLDNG